MPTYKLGCQVLFLQFPVETRLARKLYHYPRKEAASVRIQKHTRGGAARISYKILQGAAISIQTGFRAMAARDEYRRRRRNKAATIVQTQWRRLYALSSYKHKKKASLTLQCLWRSKVARKEIRMLKMVSCTRCWALKEAKDKLEKCVEELTWRLDFEKHLRVDLEEAKGQEITKLQMLCKKCKEDGMKRTTKYFMKKNMAGDLILSIYVQDEILELKKRVEEFEQKYSEVENESNARLKELEESQVRISDLH
ncbi:hypothetical protein L6452_36173 [Arctium lappa]|uniref:Uncharacterized protein n=1 Tax=Arctium lappa TaxID=4217 RepID=A0ACB8Y8M4_ARCLA|nr:hypothetical protein L6452_36173 [Arctium lappa]